MNNLDLLEYLNKCSIEFGIFDGNGQKIIDATVYNTDDTKETKPMKVRDIMYLTEYGTITIPGKRVLEKSLLYIKRLLKEEISKLIVEIFEKNINESYIISVYERICLQVRDYVRNYMIALVGKTNKLSGILGTDDQNRYVLDMFELSKYIECKLKIRN